MEALTLKTDIHCSSCVDTIEPILSGDTNIDEYNIDLQHPDKLITIKGSNLNGQKIISEIRNTGYAAEVNNPMNPVTVKSLKVGKVHFWGNTENWKRASFNTLNCLIGCSIGDFGMIIFLQAYYPDTPMYLQMILAIIAGLSTSIALESTILRFREKFNWSLALKTAFSMSFISMIGMEIAMTMTDFMITGGKAAFNTAGYWLALIPAMIAGFIFPLPYNYYKLQKHGKSCH
jgi:copper chaperone CopZ